VKKCGGPTKGFQAELNVNTVDFFNCGGVFISGHSARHTRKLTLSVMALSIARLITNIQREQENLKYAQIYF
jgi:hypothetical protein